MVIGKETLCLRCDDNKQWENYKIIINFLIIKTNLLN